MFYVILGKAFAEHSHSSSLQRVALCRVVSLLSCYSLQQPILKNKQAPRGYAGDLYQVVPVSGNINKDASPSLAKGLKQSTSNAVRALCWRK